jgi:hypothetical protein
MSKVFIHSAVCLTTSPKPLNQALHTVRSRASSLRCDSPLLILRLSSRFLRLLPRLSVASIPPFIFPSITCRRRHCLRKMWPIHLAFSRESFWHMSLFLERNYPRKSNNVVVFQFAFHIAVQHPFKPLWLCLLLYDVQLSQASFARRLKSLLMTLLPASYRFTSRKIYKTFDVTVLIVNSNKRQSNVLAWLFSYVMRT